MIEQILETFRKSSEASMQSQQEMLKQWTQQWISTPATAAGQSAEWGPALQKRWLELSLQLLDKHRESLDAAYKAGLQVIEQSFHVTEAKSSDDYRRMVGDVWRKLFDIMKGQSESQFRDMQSWAEKSFEMARTAPV